MPYNQNNKSNYYESRNHYKCIFNYFIAHFEFPLTKLAIVKIKFYQ